MSTELTVAQTLAKLKENNPNPRKIYNRNELTSLVQAILSDDTYLAKVLKVKGGEFLTEDRQLAGAFKKALVDVVKKLGLNTKEAEDAIADYKVSKALAASIIDAVSYGQHTYMKEVGKGVTLLGDGDVQQTFFFKEVGEKTHNIPKDRNGNAPAHSQVKVQPHARIGTKVKYNPALKQLLK